VKTFRVARVILEQKRIESEKADGDVLTDASVGTKTEEEKIPTSNYKYNNSEKLFLYSEYSRAVLANLIHHEGQL
jgi:hypothetical protein